jgi:hypothetical protein
VAEIHAGHDGMLVRVTSGVATLPRVLVLAALALASAGLGGCRATDFLNSVGKEHLDLGRMESDIRSSLQRRLEDEEHTTSGSVTSVGRVRCRERSEIAATCLARVREASGKRRLERIDVSVDPDTGGYSWEVVD